MENNIPTAEEFFGFINGEIAYPPDFVHRTAIEFAKLHCEAQLKAILKKARIKHSGPYFYKDDITFVNLKCIKIDKNSITNAYNLNQIK
jgi:hypothetical protein